jgi:predicted DNA-binding transcriptional regulator YafY
MSLARIAEELECAERSAKRYIRDLRDTFDYPIEYDRELGGYHFAPGKDGNAGLELPGLFFSESELSALLTMRQLLSAVRPGLFEKDLAPLGRKVEKLIAETGVEPAEVAQRIRIVTIGARPVADAVFRGCADATLSRRRLRLEYKARGRDGEWEQREVSPQRLVRYRENWYLDCWCHSRNAVRVMALDQMRNTRILDTRAKDVPVEELDQILKASYGIFSGEPTGRAVLRFTPHRAQWVSKEDWHGQQESRWLDDGSYELTVPYARAEELLMDVLKHGADVEVIDPPELRAQVAELARRVAGIYPNGDRVRPTPARSI